MAKKFFYDKVHNTKRTVTNLIIIGVCVIGIIVCFIITSSFQGENNSKNANVNIKSKVSVDVNSKIENKIFFNESVNYDISKAEIEYPKDFDISKVGDYVVTIKIGSNKREVKLSVVDTDKPELVLKEVTIKKGDAYSANDFVSSCKDNSDKDCIIDFYKNNTDEEAKDIDYSKYTEIGTYPIKITATDDSKNQAIEETKLYITENGAESPKPEEPKPTECKYGNNEYNKDEYLIAVDITDGGCAISLDLYKDSKVTEELNKLMENETVKIQKEIGALNLSGTLSLNRKVSAVVNNSGNGIVGYQLEMTVTLTKDDKPKVIAEYKIDNKGNRVYTTNEYKLK